MRKGKGERGEGRGERGEGRGERGEGRGERGEWRGERGEGRGVPLGCYSDPVKLVGTESGGRVGEGDSERVA